MQPPNQPGEIRSLSEAYSDRCIGPDLGGIGDGGWIDMGRDPNVVQVRLCEQGLEEGVGVAKPVLLDEGGVSGKAVTPVQPWDAQLASALNEEEGGGCIRNSMNGIHSCQVQWP